jgi:hypothetical protein
MAHVQAIVPIEVDVRNLGGPSILLFCDWDKIVSGGGGVLMNWTEIK